MYRILIALLLLSASQILAAGNGLVVISSNHAAIERGDIIAVGQVIELPAGKSLRLISAAGNVFDVQGPYQGVIEIERDGADETVLKSVSRLVKDSKATDFTLATFRGRTLASLAERHDIWGIDIRKSGNFCLRASSPVYLWWPQASRYEQVTLTNLDSAQEVQVKWPSGKKRAPWPEAMALDLSSVYSAKSDQTLSPNEIKLIRLPADIDDSMAVVAWMSDHNCRNQAVRLLGAILQQE